MKSWFTRLRSRGVIIQSAALVLAVLVVYAVVAPVAGLLSGVTGVAAAATAAGLCLLGAGLALAACRRFREPKYALHGVLIGMLLRMGVPLACALVLQLQGGRLAEAGLLIYLLVFYPVTLSVETALSLPCGERPQHRSDVSENVAL